MPRAILIAMKKTLLGLVLLFCFAVPYAAQAQVVVVVHHRRAVIDRKSRCPTLAAFISSKRNVRDGAPRFFITLETPRYKPPAIDSTVFSSAARYPW
jgi:hypothetical protein